MATPTGRMPTKGWQKNSDDTEKRTRVATYTDNDTLSYESTSFVSGGSPLVIDFFTDSGGRVAHKGWFINDGPGDIQIEFSLSGTTYGGVHTIKQNEQIDLSDFSVKKIRLTWITDSAYRLLLM